MRTFIIAFITTALPLMTFAHTHYCEHIHNRNGSITWRCDDNPNKLVKAFEPGCVSYQCTVIEKRSGRQFTGPWGDAGWSSQLAVDHCRQVYPDSKSCEVVRCRTTVSKC